MADRGHCPEAGLRRSSRGGGIDEANWPVAGPIRQARQTRKIVIYCSALSTVSGKELTPMEKAQVEELSSRHAALHALIDEEEHRSHPDEDLLHRLKKERLKLKDELAGHFAH